MKRSAQITPRRSQTSNPLVRRQSREAVPEPKGKAPSQLSLPMLGIILSVGAIATTLGVIHVDMHFRVRDYQIETARLQSLVKVRRDEASKIETQLGGLTRDSSLREAALGPLGMQEPTTEVVRGIQIDEQLVAQFETAELKVSESLKQKRALIAQHSQDKEGLLNFQP